MTVHEYAGSSPEEQKRCGGFIIDRVRIRADPRAPNLIADDLTENPRTATPPVRATRSAREAEVGNLHVRLDEWSGSGASASPPLPLYLHPNPSSSLVYDSQQDGRGAAAEISAPSVDCGDGVGPHRQR
jgi:hypothetical protein